MAKTSGESAVLAQYDARPVEDAGGHGSSVWQRELQLITGFGAGIWQGAVDTVTSPRTAVFAAGSAGLGYGLGRLAHLGLNIAPLSRILTGLTALDLAIDAGKAASAIKDAAQSGDNLADNLATMKSLGGDLLPAALYGGTAYGGLRAARLRFSPEFHEQKFDQGFANMGANQVPRLQVDRTTRSPQAILESADGKLGQFFLHHERSVGRVRGNAGLGTAVAVDAEQGLWMTNRHVVEGQKSMVIDFKQEALAARVLAVDEVDLALMQTRPVPESLSARLADPVQMPNDRSWKGVVIGHPLGKELKTFDVLDYSGRVVWPMTGGVHHKSDLRWNQATFSGSSGSPVFMESGETVGLVSHTWTALRASGGPSTHHMVPFLNTAKAALPIPEGKILQVSTSINTQGLKDFDAIRALKGSVRETQWLDAESFAAAKFTTKEKRQWYSSKAADDRFPALKSAMTVDLVASFERVWRAL